MTKTINLHAILLHTEIFSLGLLCLPVLRVDLGHMGKVSDWGHGTKHFQCGKTQFIFVAWHCVHRAKLYPVSVWVVGLCSNCLRDAPSQRWDTGLH